MTANFFEKFLQDAVYALAGADRTLYVARASGLYRSLDGGTSWQAALTGRGASDAVTAVASSGAWVFASRGGTILRSDDSGASWREAALTQPLPTVTALVLSPDYSIDRTVIAATAQDGVFVSTDGGESWIAWNYGLIDLSVNALAFSPDFATDHTLFAGTESGLFRSHNGGRSWREIVFPMAAVPVISVGMISGRVFAGTDRGLWISNNGGAEWTRVNGADVSAAVQAIQTHDGKVWLLLDERVIRSEDGGVSWPDLYPLPEGKMSTALLPTTQAVIVGFADGDLIAVARS